MVVFEMVVCEIARVRSVCVDGLETLAVAQKNEDPVTVCTYYAI